jgi:hypothetical protein
MRIALRIALRLIVAVICVVAIILLSVEGLVFAMSDGCIPFAMCIPDQQYHQINRSADGSYRNDKGEEYVSTETMYIGVHGWEVSDPRVEKERSPTLREVKFRKAYLDVKEDGTLFDRQQAEAILKTIDQMKATAPAIYSVIYIHGWHHNGDDRHDLSDPKSISYNTVKFNYFATRYAEQTRRLFELNRDDLSPEILAVYVGWRGESMPGSLSNLTIGDRARVADTIGNARGLTSLRQALIDISAKVRTSGEDSRTLIVGHSLGGRLLSKMVLGDISVGNFQPFGRNVLFTAIQPAIGADCYDQIYAGDTKGSRESPPSFIAFTSRDDSALSKVYWLSTYSPVAPPHCNDNGRRHRTAGDYDGYITHKYWFKYEGDLVEGGTYPKTILGDDGKLTAPLVEKEPSWLYKAEETIWSYPYHDYKAKERHRWEEYELRDATIYSLKTENGEAFDRGGAVWNIESDRNLIDVADDSTAVKPGTMSARHNAIASTGLADILSRVAYAQRVWIQQPPERPSPQLPTVPEPNKAGQPKISIGTK